MSDYKILQILSVFRGPLTTVFTLQSQFLHMRMRSNSLHSKDL